MDKYGDLTVTFDTTLTNYRKPDDDLSNPRVCLAFREKGIGELYYDTV